MRMPFSVWCSRHWVKSNILKTRLVMYRNKLLLLYRQGKPYQLSIFVKLYEPHIGWQNSLPPRIYRGLHHLVWACSLCVIVHFNVAAGTLWYSVSQQASLQGHWHRSGPRRFVINWVFQFLEVESKVVVTKLVWVAKLHLDQNHGNMHTLVWSWDRVLRVLWGLV